MLMRRVKSYGRKDWNRGWRHRDRTTLNRCIEKRFRATERDDVAEGLRDAEPAREGTPAG